MDLRDEVAGTEGTIWTNHFLRTGFEMFTSGEGGGYVAEKAESASGWLFPVGDEVPSSATPTCSPTCSTRSTRAATPRETLLRRLRRERRSWTPCYALGENRGRWEPVQLDDWRGGDDRADRAQAPRARRQDGDQGGADAGRPPQADPQGRDDGRASPTSSRTPDRGDELECFVDARRANRNCTRVEKRARVRRVHPTGHDQRDVRERCE